MAHRQQTGRRREGRRQIEKIIQQPFVQPSQQFEYAQEQRFTQKQFGTQILFAKAFVI